MAPVLTFIAADKLLDEQALLPVLRLCTEHKLCDPQALYRRDAEKAASLPLTRRPDPTTLRMIREMLAAGRIDCLITPDIGAGTPPPIRLLLADMDATIVEGETLDDLAHLAGKGEEVAAITAMAMAGGIDFAGSLHRRIDLLAGVGEDILHKTYAQMRLSAGAEQLVTTMRAHNVLCVLVSGGFTFFTERIAANTGFHHHHGNVIAIENGVLTGHVTGPVLDGDRKLEILKHYQNTLGITTAEIMAIGDGANDLKMLEQAGWGIGYHPKPLLLEKLDNVILYGGLDSVLYLPHIFPPSE